MCSRLLLSAAGCLVKHGGEDGSDTFNGAAVMGPGQMAEYNGNWSSLSAAVINLPGPRH